MGRPVCSQINRAGRKRAGVRLTTASKFGAAGQISLPASLDVNTKVAIPIVDLSQRFEEITKVNLRPPNTSGNQVKGVDTNS